MASQYLDKYFQDRVSFESQVDNKDYDYEAYEISVQYWAKE